MVSSYSFVGTHIQQDSSRIMLRITPIQDPAVHSTDETAAFKLHFGVEVNSHERNNNTPCRIPQRTIAALVPLWMWQQSPTGCISSPSTLSSSWRHFSASRQTGDANANLFDVIYRNINRNCNMFLHALQRKADYLTRRPHHRCKHCITNPSID